MDIPLFYPTQYETTWKQILQQEQSRLLPYVTRADFTGKNKLFNLITKRTMSAITTRLQDTPRGNFDGLKYALFQSPFQLVTDFDEWDMTRLGQIVLPTSDEMRAHVNATNRTIDRTIYANLGATRYIGENGTTADTLPTSQKVAVDYVETGTAVNSGLTIAKLRKTARIMNGNEVPAEGRVFVYSSYELDNLLRTTEVASADYNTIRSLVQGSVDTYMGFKFVRIDDTDIIDVGVLAADVTTCYAWHPEGVKYSQHGLKAYMDVLPTVSHALQLRTTLMTGAVRVQNEYVVQIACDRAP